MSYLYNQRNLLDIPEKYMYTKYEGIDLIQSYFSNRNNILIKCRGNISETAKSSLIIQKAFEIIKQNILCKFPEALGNFCPQFEQKDVKNTNSPFNDDHDFTHMNKLMENFSFGQPVKTSILLEGLFASIFLDVTNVINKTWLDCLVQRFEVTKKLYEEYLPGFRKGYGHNNLIELYWMFAIVLSIYYVGTNEIKYLNTLIKVCDLITSLPLQDLTKHISQFGLDLVLSSEMIFIHILLKDKGIKYEND